MKRKALLKVCREPVAISIALVVGLTFWSAALLLPNLQLISSYVGSEATTVGDSATFIGLLYAAVTSSQSVTSLGISILIALLSGVNASLLFYYMKQTRIGKAKSPHVLSAFGMTIGLFGMGCAACGSVLLIGALTLVGAGGTLALLPLGGAEIGFVAIGLLAAGNWYLLKKISEPLVC